MKLEKAPLKAASKETSSDKQRESNKHPEAPLSPEDKAAVGELDKAAFTMDKAFKQPAIQKSIDLAVKVFNKAIETTGFAKLWDMLPASAQRLYLSIPDPSGISEMFNSGLQAGILKLKDKTGRKISVDEYRAWTDQRDAEIEKFVGSIAPPAAALLKGFNKIGALKNAALNRAGRSLESDKRQAAATKQEEQDDNKVAQIKARLQARPKQQSAAR